MSAMNLHSPSIRIEPSRRIVLIAHVLRLYSAYIPASTNSLTAGCQQRTSSVRPTRTPCVLLRAPPYSPRASPPAPHAHIHISTRPRGVTHERGACLFPAYPLSLRADLYPQVLYQRSRQPRSRAGAAVFSVWDKATALLFAPSLRCPRIVPVDTCAFSSNSSPTVPSSSRQFPVHLVVCTPQALPSPVQYVAGRSSPASLGPLG
ncbi:hypothetical protein C8R44DRAFT_785790 [Mycena epipterygia]|nr:hypothetical protein C8R44DRAFT_785790 [Mycena epipterygia]